MTKDERKELDDKVFALVKDASVYAGGTGGVKFDVIADRLNYIRKRDDDKLRRSVDKALQRLRKAGRIVYAGQAVGWKVAN